MPRVSNPAKLHFPKLAHLHAVGVTARRVPAGPVRRRVAQPPRANGRMNPNKFPVPSDLPAAASLRLEFRHG
jgi:hypothetical protein